MSYTKNLNELLADGSRNFPYSAPIITAGAILWVDIVGEFPDARLFMPLDFMEVINNSAVNINMLLNGPTEQRIVPSYMIKPFRQPVRTFGLENIGAVDTVAGDIIINMRRLAPDIQVVAGVGTVR